MKNSSIRKNGFKNVSTLQIEEIAQKAKCEPSYVYKILRGVRQANSSKARAILKAAQTIEKAVNDVQNQIEKELIIIGEND